MNNHARSQLHPAYRAVSGLMAFVFYMTLGTPYAVRAQDGDRAEPVEIEWASGGDERAADSREVTADGEGQGEEPVDELPLVESEDEAAATESDRSEEVQGLPEGSPKSAVTPQAISLPGAEGSIEGMGESFTPNLSSGTGTFSVPIALPPGRAGVQPSLALSYSTSGGNGPVGLGWGMAAPFIARQTDRGLPRYKQAGNGLWHPEEDRFIYNGGQELVPVDNAEAAALDGASIPAELADWQQYRARIEGSFMRFFRSPGGLRWVVQDKGGTRFDFGLLDPGMGPSDAVDASSDALLSEFADGNGRIYQWNLTRMSDAHGSTVYYRYGRDAGSPGERFLQDIYYVSPASCGDLQATPADQRACAEPLDSYGRRVHLVYEPRADVFDRYTSTWRIACGQRLRRIEVTAHDASVGSRTLVRRYHLRYDDSSFLSMLQSVQVEGRPESVDGHGAAIGERSITENQLDDGFVGALLPPMVFSYSEVDGDVPAGDFGTLSSAHNESPSSPAHSVNEGRSDFFDVNSDGLPDLIVTDPARYRVGGAPGVGVFFNGFSGDGEPAQPGTFSNGIGIGIPAGLSNTLTLSNLNVSPMDVDGDGRSDLLHMPRLRNYGYFTVARNADGPIAATSPRDQGWRFEHIDVALTDGELDPRIDFGRDGERIKTLDVNGDHLIDVVRTSGTVMQTWLNLGWLPGGDGLFGTASPDGAGGWDFSTEPVESCLLRLGLPVDFADSELRIADMNGDGIQDIVKMQRGRLVYWPGRGEGLWGAGDADCARGDNEDRHVEMESPPADINVELEAVFLQDVNADGASDVVQVRYDEVDVYLNRAGRGFTERFILEGTPYAPSFDRKIRFTDIDGSATTDIVWGQADNYQWVDPMGGQRPRLLTGVENGLGGLTTLRYSTTAYEYLRDLAEAEQCQDSSCERFTWSRVGDDGKPGDDKLPSGAFRSGGSPVVSTVVTEVETSDQFDTISLGLPLFVKRTQYAYHDGYYEGIEQEFRGFGVADATELGDAAHPTSFTRTHFMQGRRPSSLASERTADNPREALKGRTFLTEVADETGMRLSTEHARFTVRRLLDGIDGRSIVYAFVHRTDSLRYDTSPYIDSGGATLEVADAVTYQVASGALLGHAPEDPVELPDEPRSVQQRAAGYAHIASTTDVVDNVGHVRTQTAHGRLRGEYGEPVAPESIVTHTAPVLCDAERYIWRTGRTYVDGSGTVDRLGDTQNFYNDVCDLERTVARAALPGGVAPFEFGGGGVNDSEADPVVQNADDALVSSTLYDGWGNATESCAGDDLVGGGLPCLRWGTVGYDDDFDQFPITENIGIGSRGAGNTLTTEATWDGGLAVLSDVTDPNGYTTTVGYDGLGRLTTMTPPPVDGCGAGAPLVTIAYELLVDDLPVSRIRTTSLQDCVGSPGELTDVTSLRSEAYVDGLGRTRASLSQAESAADATTADGYQRGGVVHYSARGTVTETFQPDLLRGSVDIVTALSDPPADIPSTHAFYDAFGRAVMAIAEDGSRAESRFHALSTEVWDPLDLDPGSPHYGTPSTERTDGHGRVIDQVLRNRQPGQNAIEYYRLWTDYRPDGAVTQIARAQTAFDSPRPVQALNVGGGQVLYDGGRPRITSRTFIYDTVGRRVASSDPDTDSRNPLTDATNRTWRYAFNRAGDLAAVRDPRGCGQNFYYDHAGRLLAEDYVDCATSKPVIEQPVEMMAPGAFSMIEGDGSGLVPDVQYFFDAPPAWGLTPAKYPASPAGTKGRATAVMDRGQRSQMAYDQRGNVTWTGKQLALIAPDNAAGAIEYETTLHERTASYDHAARPARITLPGDPNDPMAPEVGGSLTYNARGLVHSASLELNGVAQPVVQSMTYTRDGLVALTEYGTGGLTSATDYDIRRRPRRMATVRDPGDVPIGDRSLNEVTVVADQRLLWDRASNLIEVLDQRPGEEWPDGFRPQSYQVGHDALYRVADVALSYTHDDNARNAQDAYADYRDELAEAVDSGNDPMETQTAPRVTAAPEGRPASLTYEYDWLANMTSWEDDAYQFYERSLGAITNGHDEAGGRPSALTLATDLPTSAPVDAWAAGGGRGGYVDVTYGDGGNMVEMVVHGQCDDADFAGGVTCWDPGGGVDDRIAALDAGCSCAVAQRYQYDWDELNRLAEARRADDVGGGWVDAARQRYRYDSGNQRSVKQTYAFAGGVEGESRAALYVYPGDFEMRGMVVSVGGDAWEAAGGGAEAETQYLVAGARVVLGGTQPMAWAGEGVVRDARATVAVGDVIGTTGAVVDLWSGALVEVSTYLPNGGRETYRSDGGDVAAEVSGFTGKEADEEVGVTYFGERYLVPRLGRWASPDPLAIHSVGGGESLNSYHYVAGNLLQALDPLGLDVISQGSVPDTGQTDGSTHYAKTTADHAPPANERFGIGTSDGQNYYQCAGECYPSSPADSLSGSGSEGLQMPSLGSSSYGGGSQPSLMPAGEMAQSFGTGLAVGVGTGLALAALPAAAAGVVGAGLLSLAIGGGLSNYDEISASAGRLADGSGTDSDYVGLFGLGGGMLGGGLGARGAPNLGNYAARFRRSAQAPGTEYQGPKQRWTADLGGVTGKGGAARNRAIDAIIEEDFASLNLTFTPEYSPFMRTGLAKPFTGTQIGKQKFSSRQELRTTVVHEELHHRWFARGVRGDHHLEGSKREARFYNTVRRYFRLRGWGSSK